MGQEVMVLKGITKNFGGIKALDNVDFTLKKNVIHAILGENGAGKSTLIKIMTGVVQPDSGTIALLGKSIKIRTPIDARRQGIAAIYQELSLIESLTVGENIFLGNEPSSRIFGSYNRGEMYRKSEKYLSKFNIDINPKALVSTLGMGQKRIVEIVKAISINSSVLILDEPTTGMSNVEIEVLFSIMENLKRQDVTMVYISHYLNEVFKVCDAATVLRDGRFINTFSVADTSSQQLISAMIGKAIKNPKKSLSVDLNRKDSVLKLTEYKTDKMKEPISLEVKKSEILGITGIVGAGKSELAHSIFGNAIPESGKMHLFGKNIKLKSAVDSKKHGIAFIPEDRKNEGLFLKESVADNAVILSLDKIKDKLGLLNNCKKIALTKAIGKKIKINPLLPNLPVENLSGGNQQKVVIAKWLLSNSDLLIMDEPTRGIDVGTKAEIYDLMRELSNEDKAIIVMSSEFEELINLCDRILILYKGQIVAEVFADKTSQEELLAYSLGGNQDGNKKNI